MSTTKKEYKAKNIEAAIAAACADLKASQDGLDIEVVATGSAGIFGLCKKNAVILVSRKASSQPCSEPAPRDERTPAVATARHHAKPDKDQTRPRNNQKRAPLSLRADDETAKPIVPEVLDEIKELLQSLLQLMDLPAEVSISAQGNKAFAHIISDHNAADIIGRDGSTLDAIQYLLRKIVSQRFPDKIVLALDAGNYREDRQKELVELALEMAKKVKETGKSQLISALNPAERRIVHVTLQDDTTIRSSSIGEGLFKKVRIYLPGQGRKRSSNRGRGKSPEPEKSS